MITATEPGTPSFATVRELLRTDLKSFENELQNALKPQKKYLSRNMIEIYRRGKRFRPILLLLSARMHSSLSAHQQLPDKVIKAAVSLEMMHAGSLIHDDIVDRATVRRGLPSLNAERGHEIAMLVGDLQMITSMKHFIGSVKTARDIKLVRHYLETALSLCRGELDELKERPGWNTSYLRKRYLRTIDRKTGKLIALSCEAGARLMNARAVFIEAMGMFGMYAGRAFQVMDDLHDLSQNSMESGKADFADLKNQRISLPLIYVLEDLPKKNPVKKILAAKKHTTADFAEAVQLIKQSRGIDKAYSEARVYMMQANEQLKMYGDNPYANGLKKIVTDTVDR